MKTLLWITLAAVVDFLRWAGVALTADQVWTWLLARQYGSGPTYATWFGVVLLVVLFNTKRRDIDPDDGDPAKIAAASALHTFLICLTVIGAAALAHYGFHLGK